jgi:hypothetical protein
MKLYSYGYLSAIMIHTSTHPCKSNSTIPAQQKIRQSHITSLAFALPDWFALLPYEQYLNVTPGCPLQSRAHPASYSIGTRVLSQGVKWPGCEKTTHLHYGAKVKNIWSCISSLAICLYNTDGDNLTGLLLGPLLTVHIHILSLGVK